jgi:hypothetical protein
MEKEGDDDDHDYNNDYKMTYLIYAFIWRLNSSGIIRCIECFEGANYRRRFQILTLFLSQ